MSIFFRWGREQPYAIPTMFIFGLSADVLLEYLVAALTLSAPFARLSLPIKGSLDKKHGRLTRGQMLLAFFAVFILTFAVFTLRLYWPQVADKRDTVIHGAWLFVAMVCGMFSQVMVGNHQKGKGLFDVSGEQLFLPLLFSVTAFYSVWKMTDSLTTQRDVIFPFYTAFLNGYFWKTMGAPKAVAAARDED